VKERLAKIEAYGKAHWKELLALVLAAIPAGFLLFHKTGKQVAANAISYIPAAFGGSGDVSSPGSSTTASPGTLIAGLVSAAPATVGTSVNGSSTTSSPAIPVTGPPLAAKILQPPPPNNPPAPTPVTIANPIAPGLPPIVVAGVAKLAGTIAQRRTAAPPPPPPTPRPISVVTPTGPKQRGPVVLQ
jgi:hypothetical protein